MALISFVEVRAINTSNTREGKLMHTGDRIVFTYDEPALDLAAGTRGTLTAIRTTCDVDIKTDDGRDFTTELSMLHPVGCNQ